VKLKIDAAAIARCLAADQDEEILWDTELEGFGLRIRRRSNDELQRTYVAQYRADGRTRRVTLGAVGRVTLAQAREAARRTLARAGSWTLPAERSKTHRTSTVNLPPTALAILRGIPRKRDYLFGERGAGFVTWGREKAQFDARLGDRVAPWTLHDIRRSVASGMADIGIEPFVIELVLGHVGHRSGIAGVYNRGNYQQQVRNALVRWDEHVAALLEGRADKVVALRAS
jgi:hypothetical protein